MKWQGGCLCGQIVYTANADPVWASYCHCRMCQKISGAPFMGFVQFPDNALRWRGAASLYHGSASTRRRFCAACGSSLTFETDEILFVTLGSLERPENVNIGQHCYTATMLPGLHLADGLPQYEREFGGKGGLRE